MKYIREALNKLKESSEKEYYYNYDVLCPIYYKGGVIHRDEEAYAKSYEDLCKQVRDDWIYDDDLEDVEEYGPIKVKVNYSDDPKFKSEDDEGDLDDGTPEDAKTTIIEAYSELDKLFDNRLSKYKTYAGKDLVLGIRGADDKKTCHMDIQREVFVEGNYDKAKFEIHDLLKDAEKLVSKYEGMKISDGETKYIGQKPIINCDYNHIKTQFNIFILFKEIDGINEDIEDVWYNDDLAIEDEDDIENYTDDNEKNYLDTSQIKSNGIYSVFNGWLKEPVQEKIPDIDMNDFEKQFKVWKDKYFDLLDKESSREEIDNLIEDIYNLRKEGMKEEGEYSIKNLIFKEFRNLGYLDNLKELKRKEVSKELSLEGLDKK